MTTPTVPSNPFIHEGDPESTALLIHQVLKFLWEQKQGVIEYGGAMGSLPSGCDHIYGEQHILSGLVDAVQYLGELGTQYKVENQPKCKVEELKHG